MSALSVHVNIHRNAETRMHSGFNIACLQARLWESIHFCFQRFCSYPWVRWMRKARWTRLQDTSPPSDSGYEYIPRGTTASLSTYIHHDPILLHRHPVPTIHAEALPSINLASASMSLLLLGVSETELQRAFLCCSSYLVRVPHVWGEKWQTPGTSPTLHYKPCNQIYQLYLKPGKQK